MRYVEAWEVLRLWLKEQEDQSDSGIVFAHDVLHKIDELEQDYE